MTELDQFARLVVRRPARFHADQALRQLGGERQNLARRSDLRTVTLPSISTA